MSEFKDVMADVFGAKPEELTSKQSGKFGLNKAVVSNFAFTDKAGKDGTDGNAIDFTVKIKDREYYNRFFLNSEIYDNKNNLLKPGEPGYPEAFAATYTQIGAVIKHALGALGVTDAAMAGVTIKAATTEADMVSSFIETAKGFLALVPANTLNIPIDIFLEYQWNIREGQDRTYLTQPKNMKGGIFLCPHVEPVGEWTEVRNDDGLHYIDNAGNKHPFTKSSNFMESNKAIQQGVGAAASPQANPISAAQKSSWE